MCLLPFSTKLLKEAGGLPGPACLSIALCMRSGRDAPEEICQDFPSLSLSQVYCVIAYYLTHKDHVDIYIHEQQQASEELHKELETRHAHFLADLRQRAWDRHAVRKPIVSL